MDISRDAQSVLGRLCSPDMPCPLQVALVQSEVCFSGQTVSIYILGTRIDTVNQWY